MTDIKIPDRGMLIVYTGNGKGKSSAAFGTVFRARGWGFPTAVVQFIKGKRETGEQRMADQLDGVDFYVMGRGFTWESDDISRDAEAARKAWSHAGDLIRSGRYQLIVLDEMTYCFHHGFLALEDVLPVLQNRPAHTNIIITGRYAPEALREAADLVSEMTLEKHPFQTSNKTFRALIGVDF